MKKLLLLATTCFLAVISITGCGHFHAFKRTSQSSFTIRENATPIKSPFHTASRQSPTHPSVTASSNEDDTLLQSPDMRLAVPIINMPSVETPRRDEQNSDTGEQRTIDRVDYVTGSEPVPPMSLSPATDGETADGENGAAAAVVSASEFRDQLQTFDFPHETFTGNATEDVQRSNPGFGGGYIDAASAYTLADVEQIALANHPSLAAADASRSKAAGLRQQVGTRPNPTLGYFGQQMADRNTDQHGFFVEQEFVRGNKLQLNQEVLGHTARAQAMERETQRHRILTDVRVRFYEALAAQQNLDATRRFIEVADRGVQVAEQRERAEEGTLIETLQAKTLLSEVRLAAEQAEIQYRGAWQDLAAIAGIDGEAPVQLVADPAPSSGPQDWQNVYASIVMQSPELSVAQAIVCEKQALLRRQRVQHVPNVTGQLGAGYDVGTDNGMINLQLSAPIPIANRNQGNISAAYADYVRATQEVKRIEQSIRSRLARTAQEYESALTTVQKYRDEIIPQAEKSLELSEVAYRAGELDFLQVLVVRRTYYDATIKLIDAKGRLASAAAKVDGLLLTGGLESPVDYTDGDGLRDASFGGQ
ncbi:TolC family protein [Rhodopirellula sallentina]|uniref:Outer membrane efflux protein n=1 Tax=Rhodopirellula sallentina SM41 TaxID=1263870 RepID=M5UR38_9BACT|nr:TolC family protein [Rhodopirellula sallentina]EMI58458.1 outer membrane efflux protein [Rhodopirellula sallentina SM41]